MKALHTLSAVIEVGAGLALLGNPSPTVTLLLGAPLETPIALTMIRIGGAGLLSLGVACWFARGDAQSSAARGLVAAMLFYNAATAGFLGFAGVTYGLNGLALWPAVVLHAAMGAWCSICLWRNLLHVTKTT